MDNTYPLGKRSINVDVSSFQASNEGAPLLFVSGEYRKHIYNLKFTFLCEFIFSCLWYNDNHNILLSPTEQVFGIVDWDLSIQTENSSNSVGIGLLQFSKKIKLKKIALEQFKIKIGPMATFLK